ncbi:alpha/beta-hydrolase [Marasmius fiardii PR-910]|nr:alpha/beta-hydrolase [Marasmius fiardii PR-910]
MDSNPVISHLPPIPPASEIPNAFMDSVRQWWASGDKQMAISEERLLRRLSYYRPQKPASFANIEGPVVAYSSKVELASSPKKYLNTVTFESTSPPTPNSPPPAVLLHGYGAGLGFFFKNFNTLAQWAGRRNTSVFAVDWLGMGRSARPPFSISASRKDTRARVEEAESFFVESLEEWRQKMGLEKMTLVGHSLGAYFSTVYALKYPTRVHRLILLSPAGINRGPDHTVPAKELDPPESGNPTNDLQAASRKKVDEIESRQKQARVTQSRSRRLFTYLWEEGWSPFQVVRSTLFWGPLLVGKYSSRRFSGLSQEDTKDMHDYILNITLAKGSGEYCISHILAPGAHARMPIVDRVAPLKVPVTFVYGDQDWMDPQGGADSVEALRQAGNGQGRMYIINNAGHHVYLDNPKAVNDLIVKELDRRI